MGIKFFLCKLGRQLIHEIRAHFLLLKYFLTSLNRKLKLFILRGHSDMLSNIVGCLKLQTASFSKILFKSPFLGVLKSIMGSLNSIVCHIVPFVTTPKHKSSYKQQKFQNKKIHILMQTFHNNC